ncbi:potassium-transporting ATPase subunit KdpC [Pluralibacter gergoviae]|uniref:Potassium-transporting ATPase KdpC subunit n=1 Tax=Pluralibacter gergoviae TaxID=61647 RepID=A0AAI9DJJ5_PLUGE|nr:potassium-transporting ATPase subunit KdpC [Pluralibacter gergoviae]EKV0914597.1 potassium-transporting ATPase subunit KdpC [Pluralibacter gergoviae]EKV9906008.1 potassium-transporting ATPase subunit KdpC [Pluralibacter gergoviae]EKW7274177.1 potassium-transporting ATPase subunit KdpC [Pluralibacter gergoviae]ELD4293545.1 potassium-transporting ATPase subunit KdpC [Pluralibacter gergoviae]ELD4304324.1 potassium-transporting ATPase subunit KdpC [Pluralibacter gergoviae]
MAMLRPALSVLLFLTLMTGGVYPLVATLVARSAFPDQANGSLIISSGELRGSRLIGQQFTAAGYFHGRPSATADSPYNPLASGGSNLAASNPALNTLLAARIADLRKENPQAQGAVPVELITASASGLDYGITPPAARWQIPRVAASRHLSPQAVAALVASHTQTPLVGFIGQPVVNIVELNQALDGLKQP